MNDTPPTDRTAPVHTDTASSDASPQVPSAAEISVGTDAAFAQPALVRSRRPLRNISEVRHFFRTNEVPIYFVGATPFNLLGLDRWVRNFSYVTYYDGWDGAHPASVQPKAQALHRIRAAARRSTTGYWSIPRCGLTCPAPHRRANARRLPWCSSTPRPSGSAMSSATT